MKVLDASALLELLVGTSAGLAVAEALEDPEDSVHIPHLADVEVAHALRRLVAAKVVSESVAREAIDTLQDLDLLRHAHEPLLDRVWGLRANLTAYDATYVALAEVLDAELLTCDKKLGRTLKARVPVVRVVGNSRRS